MFCNLLGRPYIYHKTTDSSVAIAAVNNELPRFIFMVLQPLMTLFSQVMVTLVIMMGLLWLDPAIALSDGVFIASSYLQRKT